MSIGIAVMMAATTILRQQFGDSEPMSLVIETINKIFTARYNDVRGTKLTPS